MTLDPTGQARGLTPHDEFIRRFLIRPARWVSSHPALRPTRHGNRTANIALARRLLGLPDPPPLSGDCGGTEDSHQGSEWNTCPCCGGRMIIIETFEPGCQPRQGPISSIRLDSS